MNDTRIPWRLAADVFGGLSEFDPDYAHAVENAVRCEPLGDKALSDLLEAEVRRKRGIARWKFGLVLEAK